jgi:uncharacterized FlaG/YvyC family protein
METRLTPMVGAPAVTPVRAEAAPVRAAVRTDLAAPKAVTAQVGSEQVRQNRDRREGHSDTGRHTSSSYDVDRETGELIYKVIDENSQSVLAQYPYEGLLKLRAYIRSTEQKD